MTNTKAWLIAAVVFLILEILPPPTHFSLLCLSLGALAASIAAFYSTLPWLPWVVFALVSVALFPFLIPLAKFLFTPKAHASNVDALIGEKALVLQPIEEKSSGRVKIRGEEWSARTETGSFAKDEWVEIFKVEGTHVIVRRPS
jgi:membrane protein implicated in regulation of membrane protease activity